MTDEERKRMARVSDWLASEEGHSWLNTRASMTLEEGRYGLSKAPWISIKADVFRPHLFIPGREVYSSSKDASWYPPQHRTRHQAEQYTWGPLCQDGWPAPCPEEAVLESA